MVQARLITAARERKLSAAAIARAINGSPSTVGKWMRGEAVPKRENLKKLSDALGVSVEWLSGESSAELRRIQHTELREHMSRYAKLTPDRRVLVDQLIVMLLGGDGS